MTGIDLGFTAIPTVGTAMTSADGQAEKGESRLGPTPDLDRILGCIAGIQPPDYRVYVTLLTHSEPTVADLAEALDRDRSNVTRSLATLRDRGLATRHRELLDGGGHVYRYSATPPAEVKARLHDTLDSWTDRAHRRIEEIGERTPEQRDGHNRSRS